MADIKAVDHVKDGLNVFTSNLVPSLVMIVGLCIPILGIFVLLNYMAGVKNFKESGTAIEIGSLFAFEHVGNRLIGLIVWGVLLSIGFTLCVIPGMILMVLTYFFPCILADKGDMPWADALKASLAFGKANLVPSLVLMIVAGIAGMFWITLPIGIAGQMLAYIAHRDEILAPPAAA